MGALVPIAKPIGGSTTVGGGLRLGRKAKAAIGLTAGTAATGGAAVYAKGKVSGNKGGNKVIKSGSISVWGVDHAQEVSKSDIDYNPKKGFKSQGIGFSDKQSKKRVVRDFNRRNAYVSRGNPYRKDNWKQYGKSTGAGAAIGTAVGSAGGALFSRNKARGAAIGAAGGAYAGTAFGNAHGVIRNQQRAGENAIRAGIDRGDIRRVNPGEKVSGWSGKIKNKK